MTYITDGIQAVTNNVANIAGGTQLKTRFIEMFIPDKTEENSAEAARIIEHLRSKLPQREGESQE